MAAIVVYTTKEKEKERYRKLPYVLAHTFNRRAKRLLID